MKWLFVVLGLALAAAPLVYIVPRPAQRRQALLRERARQLGLEVRLSPMPQTRRLRVRREDPVQGVRLLLRARRPTVSPAPYWLLIRDEIDDEMQPAAAGFVCLLAAQPAMVLAIEHAADGVAAFCTEQGTVEDIEAVHSTLADLMSACGRQYAE